MKKILPLSEVEGDGPRSTGNGLITTANGVHLAVPLIIGGENSKTILLTGQISTFPKGGKVPSDSFVISFANASAAERNRMASSLSEALRDVDPGIVIDRQRERSDTQDFGATLAIVLSAPVATALAKGLAAWLARNSGAKSEGRESWFWSRVILTARMFRGLQRRFALRSSFVPELEPNSRQILAVLLGASSFTRAPKLAQGRAFYNSAQDFCEYLTRPDGLGLPRENVSWLFDDSHSPSEQLEQIRDFVEGRNRSQE